MRGIAPRNNARARVLFVAAHPVEGPSTRFRIHQYLPYLDAAGIDYLVRPFVHSRMLPLVYRPGGLPRKLAVAAWGAANRVADVARAARCDLVYVLREAFPVGPPLAERALQAAAGGRLVFDFDDAIYHRWLNHDNPLDRFRPADRPAGIIRRATHVVAGSTLLAQYARRFATDPARVSVLPTVVDASVFRPAPRPADGSTDGKVVVGWIGTPRNTGYLRQVWPELAEAARRDRRILYRFVGAEPFDTGPVPVEFRPWSLDREVTDLQGFHIGIMPLTDDESTRGKCAFKLVEYMACGLPAVASPVGANLDVLDDGRTGLLAPDGGWADALLRLAADPALRQRMGGSGRQRVEGEFSLQVTGPRFVAILRAALDGPGVRVPVAEGAGPR